MKNYFIAKSRRVRSTPYTSRIENQGVTAYTVYNHMLMPAAFGSLEDSYHHLKEYVQIWDVAGERQVEISGKDSGKLVQLMTCRDLSKSKVGRCYYCPIIDDKAGLINDNISQILDAMPIGSVSSVAHLGTSIVAISEDMDALVEKLSEFGEVRLY